jgi:hypothetical protein
MLVVYMNKEELRPYKHPRHEKELKAEDCVRLGYTTTTTTTTLDKGNSNTGMNDLELQNA